MAAMQALGMIETKGQCTDHCKSCGSGYSGYGTRTSCGRGRRRPRSSVLEREAWTHSGVLYRYRLQGRLRYLLHRSAV